MKHTTLKIVGGAMAFGALLIAFPASAQLIDVTTSAGIGANIDKANISSQTGKSAIEKARLAAKQEEGDIREGKPAENGKRMIGLGTTTPPSFTKNETQLKNRGNQEIDRRIKNLTELQTRVQGMKHITDAQKTSIVALITTQISALNDLKAKIDADTDSATLKADLKSITETYRIYALIMPQIQILAASDRIVTASDEIAQVSTKLQAKVAGFTNAPNLEAAFSDITKQVTDAKSQANAAVSIVALLSPDNGDKTKMATNNAALKDARAKVKVGNTDLQTARKDLEKIAKALRGLKINLGHATSTDSEKMEAKVKVNQASSTREREDN